MGLGKGTGLERTVYDTFTVVTATAVVTANTLAALIVPAPDGAGNVDVGDVVGNKADVRNKTADISSLVGLLRELIHTTQETERHLHSGERWFGLLAPQAGDAYAERTGAGAATAEAGPIVVDAGNDDWGAWTQILGADDTPADGGDCTHFDFHRIRIDSVQEAADVRYMFQVALQEVAPIDDPGDGDTYTEFEFFSADPAANGTPNTDPLDFQSLKVAAGTNVWMRVRAPNTNTANVYFYLGLHEYNEADELT